MVEIAISLAVIGFALVAIIGVLPTGMQVGRDNREETIITQDAKVLLDAIRNGEKGLDDLTNYVYAITNIDTQYDLQGRAVTSNTNGYTYTTSTLNGSPTSPTFQLTSGLRIVGLLTRPKYFYTGGARVQVLHSNYTYASVRSMSGDASEKYGTAPGSGAPWALAVQTNADVRNLSFNYRLITDVVPYTSFDRDWTNFVAYLRSPVPNEWMWRSNYWLTARNLQSTLYDLRLTFRWPILPNGALGNGRQAFRTVAGGQLSELPPPVGSGFPSQQPDSVPYTLHFLEPRNFVRTQ